MAALRPRGAPRVGLRRRGWPLVHMHIKGATCAPGRSSRCPALVTLHPYARRAGACLAMGRQKELMNRCGEMLHIRYRLLRQALAECLGTLILVVSAGK